jgi:hypothetical protein
MPAQKETALMIDQWITEITNDLPTRDEDTDSGHGPETPECAPKESLVARARRVISQFFLAE